MRTDFQNMLKSWLSAEEAERLIATLDTPPPVSIRQHALKAQGELFPGSEPIPGVPGRYLIQGLSLLWIPVFMQERIMYRKHPACLYAGWNLLTE